MVETSRHWLRFSRQLLETQETSHVFFGRTKKRVGVQGMEEKHLEVEAVWKEDMFSWWHLDGFKIQKIDGM